MQTQLGPALAGIIQNTHIRQDQGIDPVFRCLVHGGHPAFESFGLGKRVDRDKYFSAPIPGITHGLFERAAGKIQAGKMARIGIIVESDVDSVRTVVHGSFQ